MYANHSGLQPVTPYSIPVTGHSTSRMAKDHKCVNLILLFFAGDIDVGLGRPLSLFLSL
jgi:hypothetical protein